MENNVPNVVALIPIAKTVFGIVVIAKKNFSKIRGIKL